MMEMPRALIPDLLSTGYFFEELKQFTGSKEIDLPSLSRDFAVPYLARRSESYQRTGKADRARILSLAVKFLSEASDGEMAQTIFGLKKVVLSEMEIYEKALLSNDRMEKSILFIYRQKLEEAQFLGKMLITIIRVFKLAEPIPKRDKSEEPGDSVFRLIKDYWEPSPP